MMGIFYGMFVIPGTKGFGITYYGFGIDTTITYNSKGDFKNCTYNVYV